ncbi:K02A2.6-like, partial [Cordylochernes scorpioides]
MASYQFKEYNEETETFETFYERLEQFLILEEAGDEKKKACLLTLMGSKTYGVLKNLCSPILPKDKTFDNLIDILKRHFSPKRSIVVERFIFFKRMQLKEESISDYLVEIKRLASSCNFGNFLEDSLRDKMVYGLYNAKIQNRILLEGDISLAKVIEIALSMEAAEKNTKLFHLEQGEDCVDKLRMERKVESNFQNGKCKHCGKQHKQLCRFKEAICFKCNKKGHIASICWSSRRNLRQHQNQPGNIHQIGDQEEEEDDPPYLMELKVEGNFIKFEMDTGSGLTLISEKDFKNSLQHLKLEKASIIVRTYDGTVVPILGKINVKVECQDITYKLRALVVKGEKRALMGREWINRLKLGCFAVKHMPVEITIEEILKENQALFVETTEPIKGFTFSVNMCDVNPIFHKARPVPFAIRPAVTEALDKMVAKGYLCEVASSKWATPVVVVPKKNKEIRICCDFKVTLNKFLDTAAYPLPTQQDLFSTLAKGKYFSKLDLRNAYLQLEVDPGTRPLLTINTHKGLFRFKRMPFGLANAPSYFQSVMDRVLSGIGGVICYIDDVLIATASIEEHLALLKTIFARLAKYNIKLKKEKCLFLQKEIEYLGHLVTEEGIRPLDHKVQAIQKAKTPTNISELRSFLGLVNFYRKFIPNLPELLKPLHELLHKKRPWVWTKECGEAIDKCKNSITSERVLVPYDATLPLCLATDASQIGVGAVLSHIIEGQERPIMFASRTLSVAEQNYSQIEKEALAIIYGVTKFHQFIYGRKFILITDHKPLVTILGSRSGIPTLSTSRLQRWALILSAYTYDIKFRRTQDHGNADLLSRFPVGCEEIPRLNNVYALSYVEELPITAEEIATETEKDEVLSLAKFYTQQGWPEKVADHLRPYFQRKLELTVDGECLVWGMRVVIPPSLRIKMLNCLHETHCGMNKMKAVARSHFWWPNLDTQIEFLVNKCRSCQQSQDGPNKGKWQPWKWSTRPWQRIHIDFANKENINLLIVVDSHSKWIEAIPMRETTTRKTIEQLWRLFSSYGLPEELVSDNGPQFTGSEMKGFLEGNGIKQTLIPAYHPQSNGLAEKAVRTIKTALDKNKRKIGDTHTIQDTLSKVLLAYRSTPHVTTGKTPSELFIGRALRTRVSLIHPSLASRVRDQQARQMKYDRRTHLEEFQIDDLVWCKNFRGGDKWIPGKIVGKKGTRVYTILIHGQVKAYHRDQIRKRWRNGEEDESGDGERQPEHSRGAGPSAIISEVVRDRGYMESLSPGLTSQRSDQDSEVQSDTDDGKSLEPLRSLDPEALKEEGPVLRRNPPRARRPPGIMEFVTELKHLAQECEFENLTESLIRDRLIIGILDREMKRKLLEDPQLTLPRAISIAMISESTCSQVASLNEQTMIKKIEKRNWVKDRIRMENAEAGPRVINPRRERIIEPCKWCGHNYGKCPAYGKKCNACGKTNHFAVVCRTKRIRNLLAESEAEESCDNINLNEVVVKTVGSDKWSAVIIINGKKTTVHLDTGAQINVLPHKVINQWPSRSEIRPTSLKAFAYGNTELPIVGKCNVLCQYGEKKGMFEFIVADVEAQTLITGDTCEKLGILRRINHINTDEMKLCTETKNPRTILRSVSRSGINQLGIICLDPRKLNEALVGRHFQTPAPAELLHEIPKSKYYTVLDVKSAYWHIPVAKECRDLLVMTTPFGHTFVVQTDHQPLLPIVKKPLSNISLRIQRLVMKLIAFDFKLQYKPGKYFIVADNLSRDTHPMDELPTPFLEDKRMVKMVCVNISDEKLVTLQKDTREDPVLVKVIDYVIEGWPICKKDVDEDAKAFFDFRHRLYLWNDLLCIGSAIVIPMTQRNNMLNLLHQSHQGISAIQGLARESLFWPGMSIDIAEKVKNCEICQKYQKSKIRQSLKPFPVPDYPWQTVSLDIFYIQKKPHLLVFDRYSGYPEVFALNPPTAINVKNKLRETFARFGIPETMMSDNGPPFCSEIMTDFCIKWGIKQLFSSPHLHRSNGLAERNIQTIKNQLIKCREEGSDPYLAILTYRNTPKNDRPSPAQLCLSRSLRCQIPRITPLYRPYQTNWRNLIIRTTRAVREQDNSIHMKHEMKLQHWSKKYGFPYKNHSNSIVNLTETKLSEIEMDVLMKGLKFRMPNRTDNYLTIGAVETAISSFKNTEKNEIRNLVASRLSSRENKLDVKPNREEMTAIKQLKNNADLVITKSDKRANTVIMNRLDYAKKIHNILDD